MQSNILLRGLAKNRTLFKNKSFIGLSQRSFGAMDQMNIELFEHKFTEQMEFKSGFEKFKCFRVLDEEGNMINKAYENSISKEML